MINFLGWFKNNSHKAKPRKFKFIMLKKKGKIETEPKRWMYLYQGICQSQTTGNTHLK